jgi:hypothetical protein
MVYEHELAVSTSTMLIQLFSSMLLITEERTLPELSADALVEKHSEKSVTTLFLTTVIVQNKTFDRRISPFDEKAGELQHTCLRSLLPFLKRLQNLLDEAGLW